jgi:peroxiredoxin Q/BCP
MSMLKEGDNAPAFSAEDAEGNSVSLSDMRGQRLVLYFYPKDDTPGCTKEACSFRDSFSAFRKNGINVIGVSLDGEESHRRFSGKYDLPFTLLCDTDRAVSEAYGAYGEKQFLDKRYMGVRRMTFLIDEDGVIVKVFTQVKPEGHAREVLEAFGVEVSKRRRRATDAFTGR